jgi:hypothetical protein
LIKGFFSTTYDPTMGSESGQLLGSRELFAWLDELSRGVLGIRGADFIVRYSAGDFAHVRFARNLAAVIPFIDKTDIKELDREVENAVVAAEFGIAADVERP